MSKRHRNALDIQLGACNPSAIAIAIVDACREIRDEPKHTGTAQITSDPAVKLMVHQLAYLCGVISGAEEFAKEPHYNEAVEICTAISGRQIVGVE